MARADLLCELIKAGLRKDDMTFRRATQAICAEERTKQHEILANKIEQLLKENPEQTISTPRNTNMHTINSINSIPKHLFEEKMPEKRLEQLLLPDNVVETCRAIIEEQMRADLLRSYGLEPRNKILLIGPPGNGKTSLAEAIAEALMVPLITVRYDTIIGAYLGETASRLSKLFEYASTRQCVLFFDEFDTIGKERGDQHETGEIKRVVSSLLLQIDSLPSYVVAIAATNHDEIFENDSIEVWDIDQSIELKVNCRGCASENNPEMLIPYALFATFEMAPDCGVDVYQKVVDKVQVKNAIKTV